MANFCGYTQGDIERNLESLSEEPDRTNRRISSSVAGEEASDGKIYPRLSSDGGKGSGTEQEKKDSPGSAGVRSGDIGTDTEPATEKEKPVAKVVVKKKRTFVKAKVILIQAEKAAVECNKVGEDTDNIALPLRSYENTIGATPSLLGASFNVRTATFVDQNKRPLSEEQINEAIGQDNVARQSGIGLATF